MKLLQVLCRDMSRENFYPYSLFPFWMYYQLDALAMIQFNFGKPQLILSLNLFYLKLYLWSAINKHSIVFNWNLPFHLLLGTVNVFLRFRRRTCKYFFCSSKLYTGWQNSATCWFTFLKCFNSSQKSFDCLLICFQRELLK